MTHALLATTATATPPVVAAASSGPSWTDVVAAVGAAVAASATLLAATAAIFALVFARRAARAAGQQVTEAKAQVTAAQEQTRQAAELEWERSRANVVAYLDTNPTVEYIADLVIANFGATGAHDVSITSAPRLERPQSTLDPASRWVAPQQPISYLAPGQRWRISWEMDFKYKEAALPLRYTVTTTFRDERGGERETVAVLDLEALWTRRRMGMNHPQTIADQLTAIAASARQLAALAEGEDPVKRNYADEVVDTGGRPVDPERAQHRQERAAVRGASVRSAVTAWLRGGTR